jgi:hypothetical protein
MNESILCLGEFVRVDLERMYEHQERSVKSLADRVDSTIETKLQNCMLNKTGKRFPNISLFFQYNHN